MADAISWAQAEPRRFAAELANMATAAPAMQWNEGRGCWEGTLPAWPFSRPAPEGLYGFLDGRRFEVRVEYSPAFPMVAPRFVPVDPEPDLFVRSQHDWHVNGDGSLCLLQSASDWDGTGCAAQLVAKAAAWFLEYLLMERGLIDKMTEVGIVNDDSRDRLFATEQGRAA